MDYSMVSVSFFRRGLIEKVVLKRTATIQVNYQLNSSEYHILPIVSTFSLSKNKKVKRLDS